MADITMPQLGETVTEGTITRWMKNVGDKVEEDEVLYEVSTDKVDSEVPSPVSGYISEIIVPEGETADVGGTQGIIEKHLRKVVLGKNPLECRKLWNAMWGPNFADGRALGGCVSPDGGRGLIVAIASDRARTRCADGNDRACRLHRIRQDQSCDPLTHSHPSRDPQEYWL